VERVLFKRNSIVAAVTAVLAAAALGVYANDEHHPEQLRNQNGAGGERNGRAAGHDDAYDA
jgi:hypothetical protein